MRLYNQKVIFKQGAIMHTRQRYFKMSNYEFTFENLKKHAANNINDMRNITLESHEDFKERLIDELEENGYDDAPSVDYLNEAWDIVGSELWRNTDFEKPDFSLCESAFDCVFAEARACVYSAHHEAMNEVAQEITSVIDEVFSEDFGDYELNEMFIGKAGLGHIPHDYETDVGDTSLIVWNGKAVQVTVEGVTLHGILEKAED